MRLKLPFIVILVFLICLMTGCSKETEGKEEEFPPSMTGFIHVNGIEYQMEKGGYKWERKKGFETEVVLTDHASPYQMAEHINPIALQPNQKIDIKIEENPNTSVYLWNEKGREREIEQDGNQITIPSSKGKYIYEVYAEWMNGTMSYTFVIEVQ